MISGVVDLLVTVAFVIIPLIVLLGQVSSIPLMCDIHEITDSSREFSHVLSELAQDDLEQLHQHKRLNLIALVLVQIPPKLDVKFLLSFLPLL